MEIQEHQRSDKLFFPKIAFVLCKRDAFAETEFHERDTVTGIYPKTKEALQWESELFSSGLFECAVYMMEHTKRKTIYTRDLHLCIRVKNFDNGVSEHWKPGGSTN